MLTQNIAQSGIKVEYDRLISHSFCSQKSTWLTWISLVW